MNYTIYIVNNSTSEHVFWCFLKRPVEIAGDPGVYAVSSASLLVEPRDARPGLYFQIPLLYIIGVGASHKAVGPNVEIVPQITMPVSLNDQWQASYRTIPPQKTPTMQWLGNQGSANSISILTMPSTKPRMRAAIGFRTNPSEFRRLLVLSA
ncbi:hypothetical protein [Bradyrhizobium sp. STM 3809]|uniref:hypothetical protein n=1 Tax=Bradyrhizobium sp. STM 3809 TaxID=551936 RepID=UPI001112539B|nr:hypothetical protein [Bradyrhizobium sp. STM 3809]